MKKQLYILILATMPLIAFSQSMDKPQLRRLFAQSVVRKSALDSFASLLASRPGKTPWEEGYLGICNALQIQYVSGIWGKYKMLDRSRDHIDKALQRSPQDAELHFIRFMLEHNIPAFLGMSGHIKEDLAFVFSHIDFLDEAPDMKKIAMKFILTSKRYDGDQKKVLEKTISDMKPIKTVLYTQN